MSLAYRGDYDPGKSTGSGQTSTLEHDAIVEPGQTADEPDFDNNQSVTANFSTTAGNSTLTINIPESKEGMTVTVGICFE